MLIIIANNKFIKELSNIMSKFLDDFRATLEKVAQGSADDAETKAAVIELKAKLADNDATDAEQSTAILELVNKLAVSTPPAPEPTPEA